MADNLQLPVGHTIRSLSGINYRILQHLGSGGNSVAYLALAMNGDSHGIHFALKIFTRITKSDRLVRFQQEQEFLRKCTHPAVMKVYDNGIVPINKETTTIKYPFVVVDYLPETLESAIHKALTIAERLSCTLQLLSVLIYLDHCNPSIVHRDIKPQNIFIKGRSCVLGDFGLMKFLNEESEEEEDKITYRELVGPGMPYRYRTPDLVAYAKGECDLTTKSDVFQLGLVISEIFTGINPLKPHNNILEPVICESIKSVPGSFGKRIQGLIENMLIIDSSCRPSAAELIDTWEGIFREAIELSHQLNGKVF